MNLTVKITKAQLKARMKKLDTNEKLNVKIIPRNANPNSMWYESCFTELGKEGVMSAEGLIDLETYLAHSEHYNGKLAYYVE